MLRARSGFPRSVIGWTSQVGVSVGATLVASALYAALPQAFVPVERPLAQLTSGGKFAARVPAPDAPAGPGETRAALAWQAPGLPVLMIEPAAFDPVSLVRTAFAGGLEPGSTPERPAARALRSARWPVRSDVRKASAGSLASAPALTAPTPPGQAADPGAPHEESVVTRTWSATRSLAAGVAAAGAGALSRLLP